MDTRTATIPQLVAWSVETYADLPAVTDGETVLSFAELGELIDRTARGLIASGIGAGDTVAVWAPNSWQWVVAALATTRVGAVLVPVNTRFKGPEAAYVLDRSHTRLLFTVAGFLDIDYVASLADQELPELGETVILDGPVPEGTTSFDELLGRADGATSADVEARSAAVDPAAVSLVMFTSGTTGHPKGVQVRGSAIIRAFDPWADEMGVQPGDPYLLVNPYFHAFGFNAGIIVCLLKGANNVPVAVFDPAEVLALIERRRIAMFPGPPALFQALLNQPDLDGYDLSSLRGCVTGAATIPVELVVAMRERLGFERVITAYGMTETSGLVTSTRAGDPPDLVASTSGCAIDGVEMRIVDDKGHDLAPGTAGELLVRGYQITPGYLDDPEQTAAAIDADGWLHTGDVAVMNELGYIDITDRMKDMFIMGGFNAYPAEIERVMTEHPAVGLVAVIGVPDERMGEVGAAFVVPAPGEPPDPGDLIAWCREQMANYKVPRHLWLVDELPLTASNKVRKPELRALAAELLAAP